MFQRKSVVTRFPFPMGQHRMIGLKKYLESIDFHAEKEKKRLRIIVEKGFIVGCEIRWKKREEVKCVLRGVTKTGFLVIKGSSNREDPDDWDVVK